MGKLLLANLDGYGHGSTLLENLTATTPAQATEIYCGWTRDALRVRFVCTDVDPWATMTRRDDHLWEEEVVEVFIDPVGDGEAYFEFEVNPLNTVLDLALRRTRSGYRKDFAWDCEGLRTSVARTAIGWDAELTIPFASLVPAAPEPNDEWRVNFTRIDRPKGGERELTAWAPTRLPTFHAPDRFGTLRFVAP